MCACTPECRTPYCGKPGCRWPVPDKVPNMLYHPCPHCDLLASNCHQCGYCRGLGFLPDGITIGELDRLLRMKELFKELMDE